MKTIKIIVRSRIFDYDAKRNFDDMGLRALDGYFEYVREVDDEYDVNDILDELEENHPEFKGKMDSVEIIRI